MSPAPVRRREWYEKARERGFTVTQYKDSKNISHVVVGDPKKTSGEIKLHGKEQLIVFFKVGTDGPAFVLPIDGSESEVLVSAL